MTKAKKLFLVFMLVGMKTFSNPCSDLGEKLNTAFKVTDEMTELKSRCEHFQFEKKNFSATVLRPLISSFPGAAIRESIRKLDLNLNDFNTTTTNLAKDVGSFKIHSGPDSENQLNDFNFRLKTLEFQIDNIKMKGLSGFYSAETITYRSKLENALKSESFSNDTGKLLVLVGNKFTSIETNTKKNLEKFALNRKNELSLIARAIELKKYQLRQLQFEQFRNDVNVDIRKYTERAFAFELVLKFLTTNQIDYRIRSAQIKAAQGMYDIAIDDLDDINHQLTEFETQIKKMIHPDALSLVNPKHAEVSESLTLFRSKTFEEKERRVLIMLKVISKYIQEKATQCRSKFKTFSNRQLLFEKRKDTVLTAYTTKTSDELSKARHRFAEGVLLDAHHLANLCNKSGGQ